MSEYKKLLEELGSVSAAARHLGIDRHTFRDRMARQGYIRPAGVAPNNALPPIGQANHQPQEQDVPDPVEARKDKRTIASLRRQIQALCERAAAAEGVVEELANIEASRTSTPLWGQPVRGANHTPITPILFTSDFQAGEVIVADEIDGVNHYDLAEFRARYARLLDAAIAEIDTVRDRVDGVYYLRGGDAISGGIHAELKDTDEGSPIQCLHAVADVETQGIERLAERYGHVHVVSIPGNHGRIMGPWGLGNRCKGYTSHNHETTLALLIERHFRNDARVTFHTPSSGDAEFVVHGHRFLMVHGDRMKGSGAITGIHKGHSSTRAQFVATGTPVDYILSGHYHTSVSFPGGWGNGSLAGWGEYAKMIGALPDAAKQWLLMCDAQHGVHRAVELVVSPLPRRRRVA